MTFLRIVIRSIFLFEHDLRANAFRVCREGKPVSTFPDHALDRTIHEKARRTAGLLFEISDVGASPVEHAAHHAADHAAHEGPGIAAAVTTTASASAAASTTAVARSPA